MGQDSFTAQKRNGALGLGLGLELQNATAAGDGSSGGAAGARARLGAGAAVPRSRAQIQKTFNSIKITLLCGFVTILVLRGTIGVGTLGGGGGDPAADLAAEADRVLAEIRSEETDPDPDSEVRVSISELFPAIGDWDGDRMRWLAANPEFPRRVVLATSSPARPCRDPVGDHYLLKLAKNKIDYCRIHGIEMVYDLGDLDVGFSEDWSKLPLLRRLMVSHPEAEWIWWVDNDALFTDMSFKVPMERYEGHNLVVYGDSGSVFDNRSWVGLSTGSFLIRNCRWSLDLIESWAQMGFSGPVREAAGRVLTAGLSDRPDFEADAQSALIYILASEKEKWAEKVFFENSYYLHGYWAGLVDRFGVELDRPFVTHFIGCRTCGDRGEYAAERCLSGLEKAFNFADDQILELYGFRHRGLLSPRVKMIRNATKNPIELVDQFDLRRRSRDEVKS